MHRISQPGSKDEISVTESDSDDVMDADEERSMRGKIRGKDH